MPALRIPNGRLRVWAIGLALIGLAPIVASPLNAYQDWSGFWAMGRTAGTLNLIDYDLFLAWQHANGLAAYYFPYPAPFALVLAPLSWAPLDVSFWLHAVLILAVAIAAGVVGARAFGLERSTGVLAVIAWAPVTGAAVVGQNSPLALLLALLAIEAALQGRQARAGLWVALLLYKPTLALPLVGTLILRRQWRAVAVIAASVVPWYVIGVAAAGGNQVWPFAWMDGVARWLAHDFSWNGDMAIGLPGSIASAAPLALAATVGIVAISMPRLATAPAAESYAAASVVGLAASVHALSWDAALLVPFWLWAMAGGIAEPARTRVIVACYAIAPLWLAGRFTPVSVLVVITAAAWVWWLVRAGGAEEWGQLRRALTAVYRGREAPS